MKRLMSRKMSRTTARAQISLRRRNDLAHSSLMVPKERSKKRIQRKLIRMPRRKLKRLRKMLRSQAKCLRGPRLIKTNPSTTKASILPRINSKLWAHLQWSLVIHQRHSAGVVQRRSIRQMNLSLLLT